MHCVYNIIIIIDYLLLVSVAIVTINIMSREMKEELATVRGKESEVNHKKSDLEKQLEVIMMITNKQHEDGDNDDQNDDENLTQSSLQVAEAETVAVRGELKTALKRVEDLQSAISGELDSENSDNVSCPPDDAGGGGDYYAAI